MTILSRCGSGTAIGNSAGLLNVSGSSFSFTGGRALGGISGGAIGGTVSAFAHPADRTSAALSHQGTCRPFFPASGPRAPFIRKYRALPR